MMRLICVLSLIVLLLCACEREPAGIVAPDNGQVTALQKPVKYEIVALPFWARTDIVPVIDGYGVIYFYTADPANIPDDFNLLWFFDPRALDYPPAVSGFEIYSDEQDLVPRKSHMTGNGAVHFWFFPEEAINAALADFELTMPELEDLDPLRGYATHFVEELHPVGEPDFGLPGGHPHPGLKMEASGVLTGGGSFHFTLTTGENQNQFFMNGKLILRD